MAEKVVVIAGPTASGKTALSIELAKRFNGEVVSADSMQVYKGMDVGTAKATVDERQGIPHYMLDVAEPWENYSVARYVAEAKQCCDEIISRGKLPIITGGTGLYIDSLLSGRDFASAKNTDVDLVRRLENEYDVLGGGEMLRKLSEFDPERAAILKAGDKRRIVRAMEIYHLTGETITRHDERTKEIPDRYDAAYIVLGYKDRTQLYERIDRRVDKMAERGLFKEVEKLLKNGISDECTAMQGIGYKEVAQVFRGEISKDDALDLIKHGSRRYAKRQITWFRRREDALRIQWGETPDLDEAIRVSTEFLHSRGIS